MIAGLKESRVLSRRLELRDEGEGKLPRISGYAAVFYRVDNPDTEYQLWPGAVERVMPGAFDETLKRGDDVLALFNHNASFVLGRTKSGTLKLSVDDIGLRYEVDPLDTQAYRDLVTLMQRGDIDGSSFSFSPEGPDGHRWYVQDGKLEVRELRNLKLHDVSPVTVPAYKGTTSEARAARDEWAGKINQERAELDKFLLTALTRN